MVRAAATGAVDFSRGDPRDPRWWCLIALMLDEVERAAALEANRLAHAGSVALYALPGLTQGGLDKLTEHAGACLARAQALAQPWLDAAAAVAGGDAIAALAAEWARIFGDPAAPETAAKIDATVALLRSQKAASPGAI